VTLQATLDDLVAAFRKAGFEDPSFEARQLVQEALGLTFAQMMSQPERPIDPAGGAKVKNWKAQRLNGVPLAYLSKHRGFYKYNFIVEPGVLVPRPETELVVETALRRIEDRELSVNTMADLGCGTGCIGLSLISELSFTELWAIDESEVACVVTRRNAEALGVSERVRIEKTRVQDWNPVPTFDLVVANPPYIALEDSRVEPGVRAHEPAAALFADEEGLEALRQWSEWALRHLQTQGIFVCEFGAGQGRMVQDIVARLGFENIQVERDLSGHERVISALKVR
jgi:release factor glutamine methyltransferase